MAATFFTKNTFFNITKAFPSSLRSSRQVSRVYFSSASNPNDNTGRDAVERARDSRADMAYKSKETLNKTDEDVENIANKAADADGTKEGGARTKQGAEDLKEKVKEYGQSLKDYARDAKEKATQGTYDTKEKAKEYGQGVEDYAYDAKEKPKQGTYYTKEKAKEYGHELKKQTEDATQKTVDMASEGTATVTDKAKNLGEKAKETAKGAWDAAKGATQKIKETVVGKDNDDRTERLDEDVVEIRRKAGERSDDKKKTF